MMLHALEGGGGRGEGRGERGEVAKKERRRKEGMPAIRTGLFALYPLISW